MSDETIIIGRSDETSLKQLRKEITCSGAAIEDRCWKSNKTARPPPTHTHTHITHRGWMEEGVFVEEEESRVSVPVSNMFSRHIRKE